MANKKISDKKIKKILANIKEYATYLNSNGFAWQSLYLYGSWAKGKAHKDSDIDIAFVSNEFKDDFQGLQFLWSKLRKKDALKGIEPIAFTPESFSSAGNPLALTIKKEGIKIEL
ncbi:MAG: nucleotidyltransferase domain-containing protein [Patescibacteria group bacterium]